MTNFRAILLVILLTIIDQVTKLAAINYLRPIGNISLIPGVFHLTYATNAGAAFGMLQGARWFFVVLTVGVLGAMVYYYVKLPHTREYAWVRLCLILICGGAIGNFIDRLLKGYVVDFLHVTFIRFPIFNFADIFLVVGTFLLAILMLFVIKDDFPAPSESLTNPEAFRNIRR